MREVNDTLEIDVLNMNQDDYSIALQEWGVPTDFSQMLVPFFQDI